MKSRLSTALLILVAFAALYVAVRMPSVGRGALISPSLAEGERSAPPADSDAYNIPTRTKIVPIISVGSGLRLGGAQVVGSEDRIRDVKAVAQIEGSFASSVRVRILIPVSTEDVVRRISRVPETSVNALVDLKI